MTRGLFLSLDGLDGTDEWQVQCSDSGVWAVWFKPGGGVDIDHCPDANCR